MSDLDDALAARMDRAILRSESGFTPDFTVGGGYPLPTFDEIQAAVDRVVASTTDAYWINYPVITTDAALAMQLMRPVPWWKRWSRWLTNRHEKKWTKLAPAILIVDHDALYKPEPEPIDPFGPFRVEPPSIVGPKLGKRLYVHPEIVDALPELWPWDFKNS